MSTRSRIGIEAPDGSVRSVYNHSDGYPSYTGKMLAEHWTSREKIERLIALGDLSIIGPEVEGCGCPKPFDFTSCGHTAHTRAYGRDRGEEGCDAVKSTGRYDYLDLTRASDGLYAYLFTDEGSWLCMAVPRAGRPAVWRELADMVEADLREIERRKAEMAQAAG